MRRLLVALALVLGFAAPSWGATCTPNDSNGIYWTAVNSPNWTGCSPPTGADTFNIDGQRVVVAGDIAVTTGGITVTGGHLVVNGGHTLDVGAGGLSITDGRVDLTGTELMSCTVTDVDWTDATAATHHIVLETDCVVQNEALTDAATDLVSTSSDWVVFDWATPPRGLGHNLNGQSIHVGPGPRSSQAAFRPQYSAGLWMPVDTVNSRHSIDVDMDFNAGNYSASAPYQGTRFVPTVAAGTIDIDDAAVVDSCRASYFGTESELVLDNAYDIVSVDNDLGGRYVAFVEGTDVNACSGMHFKILDADDGFYSENTSGCADDATGGDQTCDRIVVAGNICGCTTGDAHVTNGVRRGDTFKIVRPVIVDGDQDGDGTGDGGIEVIGDGELHAKWTLFRRLGVIDDAAQSPAYARDQHIAFRIGGSASAVVHPTVSIVDSASVLTAPVANADASVLGYNGGNDSDLFFTNDETLDASNITVDRVYLADTEHNSVASPGGGDHGVFVNSAKNVEISRIRIERMNDDLFGFDIQEPSGTAPIEAGVKCTQCLLYEGYAATDNSQQGFEVAMNNTDLTNSHAQLAYGRGWITLTDVIIAGIAADNFRVTAQDVVVNRLINGMGTELATSNTNFFLRMDDTGDAADEVTTVNSHPNILKNSYLYMDAAAADATSFGFKGKCDGSFISGYEFNGKIDSTPLFSHWSEGCVYDWGQSANNSGVTRWVTGLSDNSPHGATFFKFIDNAVHAPDASLFTNNLNEQSDSYFEIDGLFAALKADSGLRGPFTLAIEATVPTTTIKNATVTTGSSPAAARFRTGSCSGTCAFTFENLCMESALTTPWIYMEEGNSESTLSVHELTPDGRTVDAAGDDQGVFLSGGTSIRNLIRTGDNGVCGLAKPTRLGWTEFGWAHAMLGDGVISQYTNFTTDDLIIPVNSAGRAGGARSF